MVQKLRKDMPKQKAEKGIKRESIQAFVKKRPTNFKMKREKNQHQFRGFYERLKSLDMKQSHSMSMAH